MPLSRATALIAVVLIIVLAAGYAAAERGGEDEDLSRTASQDSKS